MCLNRKTGFDAAVLGTGMRLVQKSRFARQLSRRTRSLLQQATHGWIPIFTSTLGLTLERKTVNQVFGLLSGRLMRRKFPFCVIGIRGFTAKIG